MPQNRPIGVSPPPNLIGKSCAKSTKYEGRKDMLKRLIRTSRVLAVLGLAACGTTYDLPEVSSASTTEAKTMFAQERATAQATTYNPAEAAARFRRVVSRVKPAAVSFCQSQSVDRPGKVCDLPILIDDEMPVANAYQTRDNADRPFIAFTIPMLLDVRNDDELAFVLGHEYAHHIADHIEKGRQQAMAGALILGALTATSQAYATSANPYRYTGNDSAEMQRNMGLGAAAGQSAYSQSYELESDVVATHIARAAGYDPVEGAKFFARPAPAKTSAGNLSFWGTHPPNAVRLGTVIETAKAAASGGALVRKQ